MNTGEAVLALREISISFGGIRALDAVSLDVAAGEILGLIGPNGSGKTTLLNVVGRLYVPRRGAVYYHGRRIDHLPVHHVARQGLARTFQVPRLFRRMTALENLLVPGYACQSTNRRMPRQLLQRARLLLGEFEIDHLAHEQAGNLSGGQQKLLEFARALMLQPRLILLDEPFAGVHPRLKTRLLQHITTLQRQGIDFVLVSHDLPTLLGVSSRLVVLANGQKIADGNPDQVRQQEAVIDAYLGI